MKKFTVAASVLALVLTPAAASARPVSRQHAQQYERAYKAVVRHDGRRAPGRNIVRWGTLRGKRPSDRQVRHSLAVLRRMLNPPQDPAPALPSAHAAAPTSYSTAGGYSIPTSVVMCESGGNWGAVNPSSGAGGAYQILPSTWQAYGGQGLPENASPAEQSRIAAEIWASQGPSAWACAGRVGY